MQRKSESEEENVDESEGGSPAPDRTSSWGDGRLGMSIVVLVLFSAAGLANWDERIGIAALLFVVAALGPLMFILSAAYAAGKREEAQGLIEVARIEAKGGDSGP